MDDEEMKNVMNEVGHQWRQPLAHINSIVYAIDALLYENKIENPEIEKKLTEIEEITKHMSKTIDDLGHTSKDEDSSYPLESIIAEIPAYIFKNLEENKIKFSYKMEENIVIPSNYRTLLQAIINIIKNSMDILVDRNIFNAYIKLSAQREKDVLSIKISDNGGGMTEKIMQKVFDKEYSSKHSSEGSGLGLYMTKQMLEKHLDASLDVYNVDYGACFEIHLPKEVRGEV